jgi:regulator of cell morphogenesis and NO signaling
MTVNAIVTRYPETVLIFADFGIDACCGGARTLRDDARLHALDLGTLTAAIRNAAREDLATSGLDEAGRR